MNYITSAKILTYLGIIPFAFLAFLNILGYYYIFEVKIYGALILSFLGGINWGISLVNKSNKILLASILNILICFFSFIFADDLVFLLILTTLFISQIAIDYKISESKYYENWFFKLRVSVTFLVLVFLIISIISLL